MKKFFTALALALALALTLGISACADKRGGGLGNFADPTDAGSVYAFSAASAGMIIDAAAPEGEQVPEQGQDTETQQPEQGQPEQIPEGEQVPEQGQPEQTPAAGEFSELDRYMALVGSLLENGGFSMKESASQREGYETEMRVSFTDIEGQTRQYVMYYNSFALPSDDDDDDDWDDWFDEETEEEFAIEGILVVDGSEYAVRGERGSESDRESFESETEFTVDLGGGRRMVVEQEAEEDYEDGEYEQEYSYSVYEGRTLVERSAFSYESEEGETELKMLSYKDGATQTFYFESETVRGRERILLRVGAGREAKTYLVTASEGGYIYEPFTRR